MGVSTTFITYFVAHSRMARDSRNSGPVLRKAHLYYPVLALLSVYLVYAHVGKYFRGPSSDPVRRQSAVYAKNVQGGDAGALEFDPSTRFTLSPRSDRLRPAYFLSVLVCSSPRHRKLRDAIRDTWADPAAAKTIRSGVVRVYFVLGATRG